MSDFFDTFDALLVEAYALWLKVRHFCHSFLFLRRRRTDHGRFPSTLFVIRFNTPAMSQRALSPRLSSDWPPLVISRVPAKVRRLRLDQPQSVGHGLIERPPFAYSAHGAIQATRRVDPSC